MRLDTAMGKVPQQPQQGAPARTQVEAEVFGPDGATIASLDDLAEAKAVALDSHNDTGIPMAPSRPVVVNGAGHIPARPALVRSKPRTKPLSVEVSASVFSPTNPLFQQLNTQAAAGDAKSQRLLQDIATDALNERLGGIPSAKEEYKGAVGLYGGSSEGSVQARVSFAPEDAPSVLAALAQFAETFQQEEVHARQATSDPVGTMYPDGSYATPVITFTLKRAVPREQLEQMVSQSGLAGVTIRGKTISAYWTLPKYPGDLTYEQWTAAIGSFGNALAGAGGRVNATTARTWLYGRTAEGGRIPFDSIRGDVRWSPSRSSATATRIAERLKGTPVEPAEQAKELTPEQVKLQTDISALYEQMPMNDLASPDGKTKRAYTELASELLEQYDAMPLRAS
jgi:hypothetical protein